MHKTRRHRHTPFHPKQTGFFCQKEWTNGEPCKTINLTAWTLSPATHWPQPWRKLSLWDCEGLERERKESFVYLVMFYLFFFFFLYINININMYIYIFVRVFCIYLFICFGYGERSYRVFEGFWSVDQLNSCSYPSSPPSPKVVISDEIYSGAWEQLLLSLDQS